MVLDSLREMRCINWAIIVVFVVNFVIRYSFFIVESFRLAKTMDNGRRVVSNPGCQPNEQDSLKICGLLSSAIFKISFRFYFLECRWRTYQSFFWLSGKCWVRSAECGKCGVWKTRSVENAECRKRAVWKIKVNKTESWIMIFLLYFSI